MELTPREKDKLLLYTAALVAERRLGRGRETQLPGIRRFYFSCTF